MTSRLPKVRQKCVKLLAVCVLIGPQISQFAAAADEPVKWRTGAEFRQQLETQVGVTWTANPLRSALQNLSQKQRVAVFLDRRIDPDQRVDFTIDNVPLEDAFERLAKQLKVGVCRVGALVYFGPSETTTKLATVAAIRRAEVAALPADVRRRLVSSQSWQWELLAEPRSIMTKLLAAANIAAAETELAKLPHDLWAAGDFPSLPWPDRLTVLLAGFDLTYQVSKDGSTIRFGRIPDHVRYTQTYPPRGDLPKLVADLRKKFPQADIQSEDGELKVAGAFEDHELIDRLLRGERIRKAQVVDGATIFSLNVERQPFGPVAKTLAEKLMIEVEFAPELTPRLSENISFQVKDASLKELLDALAKAAKVNYSQTGNKVKFVAP